MKKAGTKGKTPVQKEIQKESKALTFILQETIPISQNERRKYCADISIFYSAIFKSKLQHLIGLQFQELAQIGRTELSTNIIRANINCFNLIDDWMQLMTNEHLGNLEEARNAFKE